MITLTYKIDIDSSPSIVWQTLWNDDSYRLWTAPFMEGSYAESTWEEGAKISFLGPDRNGMFGTIEKKRDDEEMVIRHRGEIKEGVEELKDWKDATESYFLTPSGNGTNLKAVLTMDESNQEFQKYFDEAFPKAMDIVKDLSEKKKQNS